MSSALLRTHIGSTLRAARTEQGRTLREVAKSARVSLGYLSEVERGHKEASSELLNSICAALNISLAEVLFNVASELSATPVLAVVDAAA
jgi:transcriptional regulator with XRE-family HTH domain